jgi:hypothetical protein
MNLSEAPWRLKRNRCRHADQALVDGVLAGQRRALAKAITLIESTRADHQQRASRCLNACCRTPAGDPGRHFRRAGGGQIDLHRGARLSG